MKTHARKNTTCDTNMRVHVPDISTYMYVLYVHVYKSQPQLIHQHNYIHIYAPATCTEHLRRAPAPRTCYRRLHDDDDVVDDAPRLYQTSISPLSVRTSMTAWPKKSSLSLVKRLRSFARKSLSSSLEPANQRARAGESVEQRRWTRLMTDRHHTNMKIARNWRTYM